MRTDDGTTERQIKSKIFQFSQFFFSTKGHARTR